MQRTGILSISMGISRLPEIRLAIQGAPNPLSAATNFLKGKDFNTGSNISVTGNDGMLGNGKVFFMTDAVPAVSG